MPHTSVSGGSQRRDLFTEFFQWGHWDLIYRVFSVRPLRPNNMPATPVGTSVRLLSAPAHSTASVRPVRFQVWYHLPCTPPLIHPFSKAFKFTREELQAYLVETAIPSVHVVAKYKWCGRDLVCTLHFNYTWHLFRPKDVSRFRGWKRPKKQNFTNLHAVFTVKGPLPSHLL